MGISRWIHSQAEQYRHGEDRPLGGYVALMSIYSGSTLVGTLAAKRWGRGMPRPVSAWEFAQLVLATQKVARLLTKDPVTSPIRAPFTSYDRNSAPGELTDQVRAHSPLGHAAGELLTCPMCMGQWVATAFSVGLVAVPTLTRAVLTTFSAAAGADFLQHLYVWLQQASED